MTNVPNHPQPDDTRSAYIIVYAAFTLYGVLLGIGVGWMIWG